MPPAALGLAGRLGGWLPAFEAAAVAAAFLGDCYGVVPLSKTPFLLLIGWASLRLRGFQWRDVGFTLNRPLWAAAALGAAVGAAIETFQLLVTQPLVASLTGRPPDLSDFAALRGNLPATLGMVALLWPLAAFGEELVWRGYLLNRAAGLCGGGKWAWLWSAVLVSAVFGLAHADQGVTGVAVEGIAGALLAAVYLLHGRNLAAPIMAHGTANTIDMVLLYLGKYPGA